MQLPLQIVFHQLDPWPGAEAVLRERAQRLERFCPDIVSCRIVVEETRKHQQLGRPVAVRVEVRVPGHDLSVNRQHDTDFKVAAREAFEAMTRQLEDLGRRRREQGREHGASRAGVVLADMDIADAGPDTGQTLGETERVLGLADWIDPETGTLAEDTPVRLEDH